MCASIKQVIVILVVSLCALSLSLHFIVESVGGIEKHLSEGQAHDGDHFVMNEQENKNPVHAGNRFPFQSEPYFNSCSPTPLFKPPKSL